MCRLTPQSAGRRRTAPAPTGGRERVSTTTWPTRTTSRKPICNCTASIGPLGRLKSCCDRGSRGGDRRLRCSLHAPTHPSSIPPRLRNDQHLPPLALIWGQLRFAAGADQWRGGLLSL